MDVSFKTPQGRFNWRVAAVILRQDRLLVMRDCDSPILYLPGGRVTMGETALDALHRELLEELHLPIEVERPLWFHENFFRLVQTGEPFHELGLYYLATFRENFPFGEDTFSCRDSDGVEHQYCWMPLSQLPQSQLMPAFLRQRVYSLPDSLELITTSDDNLL